MSDDNTGAVIAAIAMMVAVLGFGYAIGCEGSKGKALLEFQAEAVRAGRAIWVTGADGKPKFSWKTADASLEPEKH